MITTTVKKTSKMPHTDRLSGVFPGDVVVEVGVVCCAANLEFLPNNAHIFIRLQEDIWRETKLWSKRKIINEYKSWSHQWQLWVIIPNNQLTLNDVDGKGLGCPLHSVDLRCADVVSIEAGVQAVDENTTVPVNCEVHPRRHGGTVVHAEAQVCSFWVGQQAGQQVVLTLLLHHPQGRAAGPEHTGWI